jgi:hypothetical protein
VKLILEIDSWAPKKFKKIRALESLVDGHNLFLKHFDEIFRKSIIVSISFGKGFNLPLFEISCSWPQSPAKWKGRIRFGKIHVEGMQQNCKR